MSIKHSKNVPPFVKWCAHTIPAVFDDSLTYYEALCSLWKWLQSNLVEVVNNNATVTEQYIKMTEDMKKFMEEYFDNLDVQEEINNKLDNMVEAGTLQEIVAAYLNSKAVFGFDTVSDMQDATNLIAGSFAKTLGFYSKNDGGSALYKIRPVSNDDLVDGMFIIEMHDAENNLVAELITDDKVNICQVGGQHNFATVCNYVINQGKSIYVPEMDFVSDDTIVITKDNTVFECDGDIEFTTDNSTFMSVKKQFATIKFNGTLKCKNTSVAFEICGGENHVRYCNLYVKFIEECLVGILINPDGNLGCSACKFEWGRITSSECGIKLACGNNGQPWINGNMFYGGQISGNKGIVTRKGSGQTDLYNQNKFENIVFTGRPSVTTWLDLQFMSKCYFTNMRMSEDFGGTDGIVLDNCEFVEIETFSYLDISKIKILNSRGLSQPNYFKAAYIRNTSDQWVGSQAMELNGNIILMDGHIFNPTIASCDAYGDTDTTFTLPEFYHNDMTVSIGCDSANLDLRYYLPNIFERRGVSSFYIFVKNKPATTRLQVYTGSSWLVSIPRDHVCNNTLYHVKISGKEYNGCPSVKLEKLTLINV